MQVSKWGNSLAVRLPAAVVEAQGLKEGDQIEIQSGVKPEDKLVASGGSFLAEGDLVRVVEAAKPEASMPNAAPAPAKPSQAASK